MSETNHESETQPAGLTWWQTNFLLKDRIKNPPREAFKLKLLGKELDLLNFDDTELTEAELLQIIETLKAATSYTKGKIVGRLIGIVVAGEESFKDGSQEEPTDRPNVAGDLNKINPVVMLNIDALRNPLDDSFPEFIAERVHGGVSMLQFIFAHEMGHAMDLSYISEVDRHGIDKSQTEWEGWGDATKSFTAFEHPDPTVHSAERGLSQRARESAVEDFAETFAIAALGGDVSAIPRKMQRLKDTIELAKGDTADGPVEIELEKVR